MKIDELKNKKILILGFGKEGRDTLSFLKKRFPDKKIGVADREKKETENKDNLVFHFGKKYLDSISEYDVIFKTPGLPLRKIRGLVKKDQELTSQDKFFMENCPGTIIGVTGTKGKGTTSSLIYEILKGEGRKVHLVGNIGEPRLNHLNKASADDVFVQELSARQLQLVEKSPQVAVFLNLYRAHLDYYENEREYRQAKRRITLFQTEKDHFIYNRDQKELRDLSRRTKARKIRFGFEKNEDCYVKEEAIFWKDQEVMKVNEVPLPGRFNLYNVMAALCASKVLEVPNSTIREGVRGFRPLPHRLERVGEYKGISFYNDSLATLPEPAICAVHTLKDLETIILGGFEAGQRFKDLAREIVDSDVRNVVLFPPTGERIKRRIQEVQGRKKIRFFETESMEQAVRFAFENTNKGRTVLLSPAAPSFGVFENYKDRGEKFKEWVKYYGQKKED